MTIQNMILNFLVITPKVEVLEESMFGRVQYDRQRISVIMQP